MHKWKLFQKKKKKTKIQKSKKFKNKKWLGCCCLWSDSTLSSASISSLSSSSTLPPLLNYIPTHLFSLMTQEMKLEWQVLVSLRMVIIPSILRILWWWLFCWIFFHFSFFIFCFFHFFHWHFSFFFFLKKFNNSHCFFSLDRKKWTRRSYWIVHKKDTNNFFYDWNWTILSRITS